MALEDGWRCAVPFGFGTSWSCLGLCWRPEPSESLLRQLPDVSPTTGALALLLVVLATATLGRLWVATVVAIVAMLALNFFFLPPVGTFTIADPQNWVALFAFLVVAVIASNLSAAAKARAVDAVARRNEVTRLFDLTRDVLLTTETVGAIDALARHVARRFELTGVAICLPGDHGWQIYQGGSEDVSVDAASAEHGAREGAWHTGVRRTPAGLRRSRARG